MCPELPLFEVWKSSDYRSSPISGKLGEGARWEGEGGVGKGWEDVWDG